MADVKALIYQYARQGFFRNIQTICEEVIRKRGSNPVLAYWQAWALYMEGPRRKGLCSSTVSTSLISLQGLTLMQSAKWR